MNPNVRLNGNKQYLSEVYDEIETEVFKRISSASIEKTLHIEVDTHDGHPRVTIWATEVGSMDDFYNEWHPEFYSICVNSKEITVEIDIQ